MYSDSSDNINDIQETLIYYYALREKKYWFTYLEFSFSNFLENTKSLSYCSAVLIITTWIWL